MKDVTKRLQQILTELESLESDLNEINQLRSDADLMQQDVLHIIEVEMFSSVRGYHLAKKLKEIRNHRRQIKEEWELIFNVNQTLKGVKSTVKRSLKNVTELQQRQQSRTYTLKKLGGDIKVRNARLSVK
ncbi:hypothetical protein [Bacillus cereus]|uniref:hypothetical protein n=1 Tax=Bacillus cereus TaxID=1396 RepID=UPI0018F4C92B|nr:hypothetical protein [Bacillus cereus]MBJ8021467.1 hypothetical protein [Bacillus cereus]MBJ8032671.1 hypothetical protein [Bacillus cereus]